MIPENSKLLLQKLLEKTEKKEANWNNTSSYDKFLLSLGESSITISAQEDNYNNPSYRFAILNSRGEEVDYVYIDGQKNEDYTLLESLFQAAKRSYFKVDETISDILKQLNKNGPIGEKIELSKNDGPSDSDLPF